MGDLNDLGWIGVKVKTFQRHTQLDIQVISKIGCNPKKKQSGWHHIEKGTDRLQKFNSGFDKDVFKLNAQDCTLRFLQSLKRDILDKHLPNKNYIIGKTNLLKNDEPIYDNQWPHTDFLGGNK